MDRPDRSCKPVMCHAGNLGKCGLVQAGIGDDGPDRRIRTEQVDCLLDSNNIFQGVYVVGKDIKPGYYLVTCIVDSEDEGNFDFFYELYDSEETYTKHNRSMFDRFNVGDSTQLDLQDGKVLRIVNGTALIQETDKSAWVP